MRHKKDRRGFGRDSSCRQAMLSSLAIAMIYNTAIKTTLAKAKELRRVVEPLVTRAAKQDSVSNRRYVFAKLRDRKAVGILFNDLGTRYKERPGGYLRILKNGFRLGDCAPMALVSWV